MLIISPQVTSVTGTANRLTAVPINGAVVIDISASYVGQSSITTLGTITTGVWNGTTIAIANGGTGLSTTSQGFAFIGPKVGSGAPSWRLLAAGDIPSLDASIIGTGILPIARGGTNVGSQTTNGVAYFDGTKITSNGNLTYDDVAANATGLRVTKIFSASDNTQKIPAANDGLGVTWNYSGGSAEATIWNLFTGFNPAPSFQFQQKTGSSTSTKLLDLHNGNGLTLYVGGITATAAGSTFLGGTFGANVTVNFTTTSGGAVGLVLSPTFNTASNSGSRTWGLFGSAAAQGVGNLTDGTSGLTGLEYNANYAGTGIVTKAVGALVYATNTSTGTVTTMAGLWAFPMGNGGGGIVNNSSNILVGSNFTATANNDTRFGLQFSNAMPGNGGFTGTVISQIMFNYASTSSNDGINWNNDTILYRGASAQLNLTGSLVSNASGTFSTSVLTPLVSPSSNVAIIIRGFDNGLGSTSSITIRGGNGTGPGGVIGGDLNVRGGNAGGGIGAVNGGSVNIYGGTKTNAGTVGSVKLFKSDGTTLIFQVNDTGIGAFATTPVGQQSGDVGAAMVTLGFMSSATSTSNVVASGRQTAQTAADASVVAFTVPAADHSYLITSNILVTASTLHNFTTTCTYTDEGNTSRVLTLNYSQLTGSFITAITNGTGASAYEGVPVQIRCKASTTITLATTGTFTSVTYNVEGAIIQVV